MLHARGDRQSSTEPVAGSSSRTIASSASSSADGRDRASRRGVRPARVVHSHGLLPASAARSRGSGWMAVDATGRTSVPGVWAAGNVVNPRAQVITAAGEGSAAAIAINNDLTDEDTALAVTSFRLGLPV